jgi:ligand-binding sensor protein
MNIATLAMRSKQAVIEECDAGMLKLVVPIFAGEEFVGAVGACGFLLDDGEVDSFLVNKMTDISEEKIENLTTGIERISTPKALALGQYIMNQINAIVSAA